MVMMPGRRRLRPGKTPPRPTLKEPGDVEVPDVNTNINTDFNTKPADEYESAKAKANTKAAEDIDDLNKMFADKPARRPPADGVRAGRWKR